MSEEKKEPSTRDGALYFFNGNTLVNIVHGATVELGSKRWATVVGVDGCLTLRSTTLTDNRVVKHKAAIANLTNELQQRRKEVQTLTAELANLSAVVEEGGDDADEAGKEWTAKMALRGNHNKAIAALESQTQVTLTLRGTERIESVMFTPGVVRKVPFLPTPVVWCRDEPLEVEIKQVEFNIDLPMSLVDTAVTTQLGSLRLQGTFVRAFGSQGAGNGQFSSPYGVAVDAEHAYVADNGNHRIQVLRKSDGAFVRAFGSQGAGNGQFSNPFGVAVDAEHAYVAEYSNHRIQVLC